MTTPAVDALPIIHPPRPSVEDAIWGERDDYGRPVYGGLPWIDMACPLNHTHPPLSYGGSPPDFVVLMTRQRCSCALSPDVRDLMAKLAGTLLPQLWAESGLTMDDLKITYPPGPPPPDSLFAARPSLRRGRIVFNAMTGRRDSGR